MGALDLIKGAGNLSIGQILRSCPSHPLAQDAGVVVQTSLKSCALLQALTEQLDPLMVLCQCSLCAGPVVLTAGNCKVIFPNQKQRDQHQRDQKKDHKDDPAVPQHNLLPNGL